MSLSQAPQHTDDEDGFFEPLSPSTVWAQIQPQGHVEGRTLSVLVAMYYHPQVTVDTRIVWGTHELFVKSVQNVDYRNFELRLVCEEVTP